MLSLFLLYLNPIQICSPNLQIETTKIKYLKLIFKGFKIFEKNKIRIYRSTLTLDRSPETYENVVNRLVWRRCRWPSTRWRGKGRWRRWRAQTNEKCSSQVCKRNKKVSIIFNVSKSILLSIHQCNKNNYNTNEFHGLFLTTDDLFHFHIQMLS